MALKMLPHIKNLKETVSRISAMGRTPKKLDQLLPGHEKFLREISSIVRDCKFVIEAHSPKRKSAMWEVHRALDSIDLDLDTEILRVEFLFPSW